MRDRPYLSSFVDRHGHVRWRFRRGRRSVYLPGAPGEAAFEAAYTAALAGLPAPAPATVTTLPRREPRSLAAAWAIVRRSGEWRSMRPITRAQQAAVIERLLTRRVVAEAPDTWGDMPAADIRRRHVKHLLGQLAETPHAADHALRGLRKLIGAAMDEEWIEVDPTYRVKWSPPTDGHRAWTPAERAAFEARWPVGTTPRLVYALALWTGTRRADLTRLTWADIDGGRLRREHHKTGEAVDLMILPPLREALDAAPRRGETIIVTAYGRPFSEKSLGNRMADWAKLAKLDGCTLHGLRTTFIEMIDAAGVDPSAMMAAAGHTRLATTDGYARGRRRAAASDRAMTALARSLIRPAGGTG